MTEYVHRTGHKTDNNVKAIDNHQNKRKRLIREAIEIENNKIVNREKGKYLSNTWKSLLRRFNAPRAYIRRISDNEESVQLS